MSKMYDEYHEYRVDTQRWQKWPKALIMTHEWSTNGNDRRLEQRRYVPDDYATKLDRLEEENAELRELVRDLYRCGDSCTHCKYWNQDDGFYCALGVGWKARRVREMGIEV